MTRSENGSSPSDPDIAGLDALDGEHGPARPLSARQLDVLSDGLAEQLAARSAGGHGPSQLAREAKRADRTAFGRRHGSRRAAPWLVIAAGATLATAAAALYGTSWLTPAPPASRAAGDDGAVRDGAAGTPRERAASDRVADGAAGPAPGAPVAPAPASPDAATDPDGRPTSDRHTVPDREGRTGAITHDHESRQAADHLARANALRGKHRYREALERYLYVISEYPGSMQSRAAELAAAAIRLEQLSDVDGAEALYRAVRNSSDGELAAQAVFGLADVARARADRDAEALALRELLARHGGHPLAPAARRRLTALEAP